MPALPAFEKIDRSSASVIAGGKPCAMSAALWGVVFLPLKGLQKTPKPMNGDTIFQSERKEEKHQTHVFEAEKVHRLHIEVVTRRFLALLTSEALTNQLCFVIISFG